jgi:hypothetical protein
MRNPHPLPPAGRALPRAGLKALGLIVLAAALPATPAHASLFKGEALDKMADVLTWIVLIVHILPEKIAEKREHPQAKAIQTLCLLSLVFGGLLWPLAWLWAYSKPVMYKLAYGTDKVAHGHDDASPPSPDKDEAAELKQLRQRLAELESKQAGQSATKEGKA